MSNARRARHRSNAGVSPAALLVALMLIVIGSTTGCGGKGAATPAASPTGRSTVIPTDLNALFGSDCGTLPSSPADPSSPQWMDGRGVRDIVTHNPQLTELSDALVRTDLLHSFDTPTGLTMLFPTDTAFAKVAGWRMAYVRSNIPLFIRIVKHHVIPASLNPKQLNLNGPFDTLEGGELRVYGFGENLGIGQERSHVICGNIHAKNNITVYFIDRVLAVS